MTQLPAAGLPPLYGQPMVLRFPEHRSLGLRREGGFAFAAETAVIPLTLPEFAASGRSYPIVFAADAGAMPLALTGLRVGRNLFVDGAGAWRAGCYVPAYLRRYPFIAVEVEAGGPRMLGLDGTSRLVSTDAARDGAEPLFTAEGGPTERAEAAMRMCDAYATEHAATQAFAAALVEHTLLVERTAEVRLAQADGEAGEAAHSVVAGFQVVDEAAFRALPGEVVAAFHARGWLAPIVLHLASQLSWQSLLDAASAQDKAG
ncbi:SapC family protein [Methylorubrum zatmanii]